MNKKLTSTLIIAGAIGISLFICKDKIWKKPEQKQVNVSKERVAKLYRIDKLNEAGIVTYPGVVKTLKHAELYFRVSGPVKECNLKVGQKVKEGDILMKLDQRDYQREIDKISQDMKMLKEERDLNRVQYERIKKLYDEQAISKADFDKATAQTNISETQVNALGESLKKAKDSLNDTYLKAPFTGYITDLKIKQFEIAKANVPVMTLDDLENVEIHISIPGGNMFSLKPEDRERLKNMSFDVRFTGRNNRVLKASVYSFKAVASENSESYDLTLKLETPDDFMVLPGMSVEVDIPEKKQAKSEIISVPFASVFKRGENSYVWVFNQATKGIVAREVKIGEPVTSDSVAILSGLSSGEFIIGAGVDWLADDNTIRVMNPEVLNANR